MLHLSTPEPYFRRDPVVGATRGSQTSCHHVHQQFGVQPRRRTSVGSVARSKEQRGATKRGESCRRRVPGMVRNGLKQGIRFLLSSQMMQGRSTENRSQPQCRQRELIIVRGFQAPHGAAYGMTHPIWEGPGTAVAPRDSQRVSRAVLIGRCAHSPQHAAHFRRWLPIEVSAKKGRRP